MLRLRLKLALQLRRMLCHYPQLFCSFAEIVFQIFVLFREVFDVVRGLVELNAVTVFFPRIPSFCDLVVLSPVDCALHDLPAGLH